MLEQILSALEERSGLAGWKVRHITKNSVQLFAIPDGIEAQRETSDERFDVELMSCSYASSGERTCGTGEVTLLPGDDIEAALDLAALTAGKIHNPPYTYPGPAQLPQVPVLDVSLQEHAAHNLEQVLDRTREALRLYPAVHLTAAEGFVEEVQVHLRNSLGLDSSEVMTQIELEFVLRAQKGDQESESFFSLSRRRMSDLPLEEVVRRQAQFTIDKLDAAAPQAYNGPVVLREEALAGFLNGELVPNGGVIQTLSSAESKFSKVTSWEIGHSIFKGEVPGEPLTVWANRMLPYGTHSDHFDIEGLPAQRLLLVEDNRLATFWATKRYADYLDLPPTGEFGNLELLPGRTPAQQLLVEPHLEIAQLSWFNPDPVSGDFACEIRLGYRVEGERRQPVCGGLLVGNLLDALAHAQWSTETGFYGSYQGPATARFGSLQVTAG